MQSSQQQHRVEAEATISTKLDGFASRIQEQSTNGIKKMGDNLKDIVETNLKDNTEKVMKQQLDGMRSLQKRSDENARAQHEKSQEMHTVLASVLEQTIGAKDRCIECSERVALLSDQLGCNEEVHASPKTRRSHSAAHAGGG